MCIMLKMRDMYNYFKKTPENQKVIIFASEKIYLRNQKMEKWQSGRMRRS
jgi:hypothetical protein